MNKYIPDVLGKINSNKLNYIDEEITAHLHNRKE